MRIDAHQHFWRYQPVNYGWIDEKMAVLKRDFLPSDLKPLLSAMGFEGCVAVQARQSLEETRWLLELAEQNDFIRGVVGWVDLCSADLSRQLEQFSDHPKLRGVRHVLQDEPDDDFILRDDFFRGIGQLEKFDLAYDILIFPRHLSTACQLVEAFPRQRFVLDHLAKPPIAEGMFEPWEQDLRALAALPNIFCKLSGMVTEARWKESKPEDFLPYLDVAFDAFGPSRLMIGSDWPVCTVSNSYESTLRIVTDYIQQLPAPQQDGILGKNCAAFYRLDA